MVSVTQDTIRVNSDSQDFAVPSHSVSELAKAVLVGLPVTISACGLTVSSEASDAEKEQIGERLYHLRKQSDVTYRFMIGDWWRSLPSDEYGAKLAALSPALFGMTDVAKDQLVAFLKNCGWIAGKWPSDKRSTKYGWTFYKNNKPGYPVRTNTPHKESPSHLKDGLRIGTHNTETFSTRKDGLRSETFSAYDETEYTEQDSPLNLPVEMDGGAKIVRAGHGEIRHTATGFVAESVWHGLTVQVNLSNDEIDRLIALRTQAREQPERYAAMMQQMEATERESLAKAQHNQRVVELSKKPFSAQADDLPPAAATLPSTLPTNVEVNNLPKPEPATTDTQVEVKRLVRAGVKFYMDSTEYTIQGVNRAEGKVEIKSKFGLLRYPTIETVVQAMGGISAQ